LPLSTKQPQKTRKKAPPPATKSDQANKIKSYLIPAPVEPSSEEDQDSQDQKPQKSDNDVTVDGSPVDEDIEINNTISGIGIEKLLEFLNK
jgi:hypothetical protein